MQCVDCHFLRDDHGDGTLYTEPRAATSIECIDCHGTVDRRPTLTTSGNGGKVNLMDGGTPWGPRFVWEDVTAPAIVQVNGQPVQQYITRKVLYQYSNMDQNKRWEVPQTIDTVDPSSPLYNAKSAYAKTLARDGTSWGTVPGDPGERLTKVGPQQREDHLPGLPFELGDELLRLPPADEGERAHAAQQVRGRHGPQLHHVQSAGRPRRRVHAGHRQHGEEEPHGGAALLQRGGGQLTELEPRMGVCPAADRLRRGLQRPGFQPALPAHHQRRRHHQGLHGLPSLRRAGQQRLDDATARLRHRDGEFLWPVRLAGRGQGGHPLRRLDRGGRAAGRHRQPPAKTRLPQELRGPSGRRRPAQDRVRTRGHRLPRPDPARRVRLHRQRQGRLPDVRHRQHRQQGVLRAVRLVARVALR